MAAAAQESDRTSSGGHLSLSGISVLMALALAIWEVYFFWGAGPNGIFSPDRLGFNMAWLIFFYLSFQLVSIPFSIGYREQFVGVLYSLCEIAHATIAGAGKSVAGNSEASSSSSCLSLSSFVECR